uniref:Uncharacterized protein n=1 Tax=viral metagenome TaxID=1070528 RepID=A0A6M3M5D2_9ZZZZ
MFLGKNFVIFVASRLIINLLMGNTVVKKIGVVVQKQREKELDGLLRGKSGYALLVERNF